MPPRSRSPRLALALVIATLALGACAGDPPLAPRPGPAVAPRGLSVAIDRPALQPVLDAAATTPVARVEIVPAFASLVYDSARQVMDHEFTAVAYDAAGNVLDGREVIWTDETNWHPWTTPQLPSPATLRLSLPYPNAAAPVRTPRASCVLDWKGVRATVEGVSAFAPICGTFAVTVAAEPGGFVPVTGDTIHIGAGQQCRITARATGGHGPYDYLWRLDGADLAEGPTLTLTTPFVDAYRTLGLRVSDEGHDINPWREMTFVLHLDASGDAKLDC